jgi:hypothetical protein
MNTTTTAPLYVIMTRRSAKGAKYGHYSKLALVKLTQSAADDYLKGIEPTMISTRSHSVTEIIEVIEPVSTGANFPRGRCQASQAYQSLELIAKELNR